MSPSRSATTVTRAADVSRCALACMLSIPRRLCFSPGTRRFGRLPPTAKALEDLRGNPSEQRTGLGLNRDRRMADKPVARPVITKAGHVLDRQNMQTIDARSRAKRRLHDNLRDRHLVIPKKPPNPDLARSVPARAAHRNPPRPSLDKTIMQKAPGFIQTTISEMRDSRVHVTNSRSYATSRTVESASAANGKNAIIGAWWRCVQTVARTGGAFAVEGYQRSAPCSVTSFPESAVSFTATRWTASKPSENDCNRSDTNLQPRR
ncbi:MAG: hypothetical protein OXL68_14755 [Paracoccaceae bacterium]|nr:hypothetical protein [Paracoccaceae bacterium]